jgi:hypothetical protein
LFFLILDREGDAPWLPDKRRAGMNDQALSSERERVSNILKILRVKNT